MILHPDTRVWVKYHAKFGFMILPSITMEVAFQLYSFHWFHVIMCFLGVIGKRFQDGGLRDILIESNIAAEGSIHGVLSGKHYNRSIRSVKIV